MKHMKKTMKKGPLSRTIPVQEQQKLTGGDYVPKCFGDGTGCTCPWHRHEGDGALETSLPNGIKEFLRSKSSR